MRPMNFDFDAQVTAALVDSSGAVFALGDGSIRFEDRTRVEAHDGTFRLDSPVGGPTVLEVRLPCGS